MWGGLSASEQERLGTKDKSYFSESAPHARGGGWEGEPCGVPGCSERHWETLFYRSRDRIRKIAGVVCF